MNEYAKEYNCMLGDLRTVIKKFRGYNGSEEHKKVLDSCIENGKKIYTDRGIIAAQDVEKCFAIASEMVTSRPKIRKNIEYLQKCIDAEKSFYQSMELEEETLQAMMDVVQIFGNEVKEDGTCTDDGWEQIIQHMSMASQSLLGKLNANEVSRAIHHKIITEALQVPLSSIEERQKQGGNHEETR